MFNDLTSKYKPFIVLGVIIFILTGLNLYMLYLLNEKEETPEIVTQVEPKKTIKLLKVDIKGEIKNPGLYEVESGSRVMDVINKAGGLNNTADTTVINLSKKVKDEMVILIYSKEEVLKMKEKSEASEIVCPEVNDACAKDEVLEPLIETNEKAPAEIPAGKININTATLEELQTLTGIGEAKAQAIIEYRSQNGKFSSTEDIKNVNGIGEALFEKIKNNITV